MSTIYCVYLKSTYRAQLVDFTHVMLWLCWPIRMIAKCCCWSHVWLFEAVWTIVGRSIFILTWAHVICKYHWHWLKTFAFLVFRGIFCQGNYFTSINVENNASDYTFSAHHSLLAYLKTNENPEKNESFLKGNQCKTDKLSCRSTKFYLEFYKKFYLSH